MTLSWIIKVWYSPSKTFKEIAQKPDVVGPIIILLISALIAAGFQHVARSKTFMEELVPEGEEWTDSTALWSSNGRLSNNTEDKLMGNYSIQCLVENETYAWMKLNLLKNDQTVNCSEKEKLYFGLKWNHSSGMPPTAVRVKLFSTNETDFFELDITEHVEKENVWANVTLNITNGNKWSQTGNPTWEKITSIKFEWNWTSAHRGNITILVDDIAFGGKFEPLTTQISYLEDCLYGITDLLILWMVYFAVLFVFMKALVADFQASGKSMFLTLGYAFSVEILRGTLSLILALTLPTLYFGYTLTLQEALAQSWTPMWTYQVVTIFSILIMVWVIHLAAVALRTLHDELSWIKALAISAVAYLAAIILRALIFLFVGI